MKTGAVHTVIKVGGGVLAQRDAFDAAAAALTRLAGRHAVLVVPGGGPFADAVREVDSRLGLDDDAAHWMAVLGMEQYAHLLASRIAGAALAESPAEVHSALEASRLPVLAPYRWLCRADPLPHSWDVTSDSIAAWVAGALGARRLILLKPAAGDPARLTDPYFARALATQVECTLLPVAEAARLEALLSEEDARGQPLGGSRHLRRG